MIDPGQRLEYLVVFMSAFYGHSDNPLYRCIGSAIREMIHEFRDCDKKTLAEKARVFLNSEKADACEPLAVALCQFMGQPEREFRGKPAHLRPYEVMEVAKDVLEELNGREDKTTGEKEE
jgi:hypothetical protein